MAIGQTVVNSAQSAGAFSAGIECLHFSLLRVLEDLPGQ